MQMLTTASKLDWSGWFAGLMGSFISGGAGAVGAVVGIKEFDPSHDIVGLHLVEVMGVAFLISGLVSMAKYLQTHPVPEAPKVVTP